MNATTIRVDVHTRDRLISIAEGEFHGVTLGEALRRLIDEHEMQLAHAAYARLQSDQAAWREYQGELADWDSTAADGLGDAAEEWPELNE